MESLLDEQAAAAMIGCSAALMRKWRRLRQGPRYCKVGRLVRYAARTFRRSSTHTAWRLAGAAYERGAGEDRRAHRAASACGETKGRRSLRAAIGVDARRFHRLASGRHDSPRQRESDFRRKWHRQDLAGLCDRRSGSTR